MYDDKESIHNNIIIQSLCERIERLENVNCVHKEEEEDIDYYIDLDKALDQREVLACAALDAIDLLKQLSYCSMEMAGRNRVEQAITDLSHALVITGYEEA